MCPQLTPTDGPLSTNGQQEGTGLRYIKARLEESFSTRWRLSSTPSPEGWKTVIEIYH